MSLTAAEISDFRDAREDCGLDGLNVPEQTRLLGVVRGGHQLVEPFAVSADASPDIAFPRPRCANRRPRTPSTDSASALHAPDA